MNSLGRMANRRDFMRIAGLSATTGLIGAAAINPLAEAAPNPQKQERSTARSMGAKMRELLQEPEPVAMPGHYDLLSARMAELNGFRCLFHGGGIESEDSLVPDHRGLVSPTELVDMHERTARDIGIPIMADVDDLGGDPLSAYKYTKLFERAGLGGIYFVDATTRSEVHYRHDLFSTEDMIQIIHAAADARSDMVLCVDCYSHQNEKPSKDDLKRAIERGVAYAEAGADVLYSDAITTIEESKYFADQVKKPAQRHGLIRIRALPPGNPQIERESLEDVVLIGRQGTNRLWLTVRHEGKVDVVPFGMVVGGVATDVIRPAGRQHEEQLILLARRHGFELANSPTAAVAPLGWQNSPAEGQEMVQPV